jgi:hypothetical protein
MVRGRSVLKVSDASARTDKLQKAEVHRASLLRP